jgi:hypothetical protein
VTKPEDSGWERSKRRLLDFCHKLLLDRVGGAELTGNLGQKQNVSTRLLSQMDVQSCDRVGAPAQRVFYI